MASNRDPRPSYRRRRRNKPTSSATRSKRQKASTAPKPTSSATRGQNAQQRRRRGQGARVTSSADRLKKNPVSGPPRGAQGPRSAPVQGPRQKVSGLVGSRSTSRKSPPKVKGVKPSAGNVGSQMKQAKKVAKANPGRANRIARTGRRNRNSGIKGTLAAGLVTAAASGALRNPVSRAKGKAAADRGRANAGKYNTRDADGTIRSRKRVGPKSLGPKKVGPAKVGTIAQAFDRAYGNAKKAGKKTFMFKGKKYTTN